jgi:hypothetical protein
LHGNTTQGDGVLAETQTEETEKTVQRTLEAVIDGVLAEIQTEETEKTVQRTLEAVTEKTVQQTLEAVINELILWYEIRKQQTERVQMMQALRDLLSAIKSFQVIVEEARLVLAAAHSIMHLHEDVRWEQWLPQMRGSSRAGVPIEHGATASPLIRGLAPPESRDWVDVQQQRIKSELAGMFEVKEFGGCNFLKYHKMLEADYGIMFQQRALESTIYQ